MVTTELQVNPSQQANNDTATYFGAQSSTSSKPVAGGASQSMFAPMIEVSAAAPRSSDSGEAGALKTLGARLGSVFSRKEGKSSSGQSNAAVTGTKRYRERRKEAVSCAVMESLSQPALAACSLVPVRTSGFVWGLIDVWHTPCSTSKWVLHLVLHHLLVQCPVICADTTITTLCTSYLSPWCV